VKIAVAPPPRRRSLLLLLGTLLVLTMPGPVRGGPVEIRVGRAALDSFLSAAFPLTVEHRLRVLMFFEVPLRVTLSHPGPVTLVPGRDGAPPTLKVAADYEIRADSPLVASTKGRMEGLLACSVSPEGTHLVLSFTEVELRPSPAILLRLTNLFRPVRFPLFNPFPLRVQDREIEGRLRAVTLAVEGEALLIRGELTFANPPGRGSQTRVRRGPAHPAAPGRSERYCIEITNKSPRSGENSSSGSTT